jgi:hypothetical protein
MIINKGVPVKPSRRLSFFKESQIQSDGRKAISFASQNWKMLVLLLSGTRASQIPVSIEA